MAQFEGYERREAKILAALKEFGISSIDECKEICDAKGIDPYKIVEETQPICFENAKWAYVVGAAIAIKKGCTKAADAAAAIGIGLQAFCIPGSVAENRKVGLGHGNLGAMLLSDETECLRGSYGEVGNDRLGGSRRYYYLPNTYNLNQGGYYLGNNNGSSANAYFAGATEGVIGNPDITWERSRKYDAGIETKFFSDRLSVDFDYFYEKRDNILTTLGTIPAIYGVSASAVPPANVGITQNQGYELVLNWSDTVGDLTYSIGGDLSWTRNKIIYKATDRLS